MFKHILLPTDGSELSEKAVRNGIRLAQSLGAKVTGLCIMPELHPFFYETEVPAEAQARLANQCKETAKSYLSTIETEARAAKVGAEIVYVVNDCIYETIIRVAEDRQCDLIFMASHGRRGIKALIIGSETQKVLTHSKIPVMVDR